MAHELFPEINRALMALTRARSQLKKAEEHLRRLFLQLQSEANTLVEPGKADGDTRNATPCPSAPSGPKGIKKANRRGRSVEIESKTIEIDEATHETARRQARRIWRAAGFVEINEDEN